LVGKKEGKIKKIYVNYCKNNKIWQKHKIVAKNTKIGVKTTKNFATKML
jgi:hypothetical protein